MKNNKIKIIGFAMIITVATNTFAYTGSYQEKSWSDVKKETIGKIKEAKESQRENLYYKMNKRIEKIEKNKRTSFVIRSPKVVDVYLRESFTILESDFVIKNAPVWKKILIKEKELWDY